LELGAWSFPSGDGCLAKTYPPRAAVISGFERPGCLGGVGGPELGASDAETNSCIGSSSPIPSNMLEQEAQIFGFRDSALPLFDIGSQQHMQTVSFK
jgi:hypothetical protein